MTSPRPPDFEISLEDEELVTALSSFEMETDDIPVLTDVVDERIEPFIGNAPPPLPDEEPETLLFASALNEPILLEPMTPFPASSPGASTGLSDEQKAALQAAIAHHLEKWVSHELPQLLYQELDELAERLSRKAASHLQATVLPAIVAEIDETLAPPPPP